MAAKKVNTNATKFFIGTILLLLAAIILLTYKLHTANLALTQVTQTPTLSMQDMTYDPTPNMLAKNTDGTDIFKHPELSYTVDIPTGWVPRIYRTLAGAAVQPYEDVIFLSPDYQQTPSNVYTPIIAKGASIFIRGAETVYNSTQERFDNNPVAKRIAQDVTNTTVNGISAIQYDYNLNGENVTNVTFVKDKKWYLIKFQYADDDTKSQYWSTFEGVIKSFKLK